MLKALIFDLGNVLVFFDRKIAVRQVAALGSLDEASVDQFLHRSEESAAYEKGAISTADFCEAFEQRFGIRVNRDALLEAASDMFTPNNEMIAVLDEARSRNLRLVLLSNTCEAHIDHLLRKCPFLQLFDGLVLSFKEGVMKPCREIYALAATAAGCRPDEALFTDDLIENVTAAREFGFHALVYTDPASYRQKLLSLLK